MPLTHRQHDTDDPDHVLNADPTPTERTALLPTKGKARETEESISGLYSFFSSLSHSSRRRRAESASDGYSDHSADTASPTTRGRGAKGVSLLLLNNGSVARDHLASERTFLAYVRTSLGLASAGVALMQFFQLDPATKKFANIAGGLTIFTSLLVLGIGTRRFFLVQKVLVTGYYPVTILEVAAISFVLGTIVSVTFAAILSAHLRS